MFRKSLNIRSASVISARITNLKSRNYCSLNDDLLDNFDKARKYAIRREELLPVFYHGKYASNEIWQIKSFADDCLVEGDSLIAYKRDIDDEWKRYFKIEWPYLGRFDLVDMPGYPEYYRHLTGYTLKFSSIEKFLIQHDEKPANMREFMELYDEWCYYNDMIPYPYTTVACKLSGDYKILNERMKVKWE